jgi:rhodanese-related sulfurtransferase
MMHDSPTIDILDVRSLSERRAEGHISKSQSWPFDELKGGLAELEPLRRRTFLVYDSGAEGDDRAKRAVLLLRSEGWPEAVLLEGGLVLWRRYGFGVIGGTVD